MTVEPNAFRNEALLRFGERDIVLRCSWAALAKMLPHLMHPAPEVGAERERWLGIAWAKFPNRSLPPLEQWEWHHHLLGALAAHEVHTVARCVAILAQEHHPEVTYEEVLETSPSWNMLGPALGSLAYLFHWHPGEEPTLQEAGEDGPFAALIRWSAGLSRWLPRTASLRPSSGA
jgi:hypothetical protein